MTFDNRASSSSAAITRTSMPIERKQTTQFWTVRGLCLLTLLMFSLSAMEPCGAEVTGWTRYYKEWKKCFDVGDFKGAVEVATRELEKHPRSFGALSLRGQTYMELEEYQKALDDANAKMGIKEEHFLTMSNHLDKAEALIGLKSWEEALRELRLYQSDAGEHVIGELPIKMQLCRDKIAAKNEPPAKELDIKALAQQLAAVMEEKQKAKAQENSAVAEVTPQADAKPVNRPVRDKWALVIGVSKFQDKTIPELRFAAKDAEDFSKFLVNNANFSKDHVRLLTNESATQRRILDELGDKFLPRVVKPDDLVVIYFSSHGSPSRSDVRGKNFLIAHDSEKRNLYASGIEMQQLSDVIKDRVQSDRVLLVLDACHSGATTPGEKGGESDANFNLQAIPLGSGQTVICSSKAEERSWESKRYENGVFTKRLMQALIQDGEQTTIDKAYSHLSKQVEDEVQQDQAAKQTPVFRSTWKGNNLMLCTPPAAPEPMPDAVRSLLAPERCESRK
ncbi:MAG: caspase family protein [Candidatus Obscuribacterales bacterium]|nr:caspase family protein [Candidatus Obscuribacterales bacterium]